MKMVTLTCFALLQPAYRAANSRNAITAVTSYVGQTSRRTGSTGRKLKLSKNLIIIITLFADSRYCYNKVFHNHVKPKTNDANDNIEDPTNEYVR